MNLLTDVVIEVCKYLKNIEILRLLSVSKYYRSKINKIMFNKVIVCCSKLSSIPKNINEQIKHIRIINNTNIMNHYIDIGSLPKKLISLYIGVSVCINLNNLQKIPNTIKKLKIYSAFESINNENIFKILGDATNSIKSVRTNVRTDLTFLSMLPNIKKITLCGTNFDILDEKKIKMIPSTVTYVNHNICNFPNLYIRNMRTLLNNLKSSVTKLRIYNMNTNIDIPSHIKVLKIKSCSTDIIIPNFINRLCIEYLYSDSKKNISVSKNINRVIIKNYNYSKITLSIDNYIDWYD